MQPQGSGAQLPQGVQQDCLPRLNFTAVAAGQPVQLRGQRAWRAQFRLLRLRALNWISRGSCWCVNVSTWDLRLVAERRCIGNQHVK